MLVVTCIGREFRVSVVGSYSVLRVFRIEFRLYLLDMELLNIVIF